MACSRTRRAACLVRPTDFTGPAANSTEQSAWIVSSSRNHQSDDCICHTSARGHGFTHQGPTPHRALPLQPLPPFSYWRRRSRVAAGGPTAPTAVPMFQSSRSDAAGWTFLPQRRHSPRVTPGHRPSIQGGDGASHSPAGSDALVNDFGPGISCDVSDYSQATATFAPRGSAVRTSHRPLQVTGSKGF